MTIQNTTRLSIGTGNGATTTWPYNFLIPTTDDVVVSIYNADTNVKIEDVAPADYTITGVGDTNGGNVEYPLTGSPLASDRKIVILRVMDYHQDLDISNQGGFHADTLEAQLDRTTMQIQQLAEASGRTITLPPTNDVDDAEALTQAILAVEDIETEIETVAGISGDVTTVAGISTEVTTVAGISDAIQNASGLLRGVDVRAASNSNISLASLTAGSSAGGVTLAAGDYYGVFGNTDATENGIYTIQASGAPVRHTSFDTWDEIAGGVFHVREGDLAGRQYLNLNASGGGTIDTNDLHFRPHSLAFDTVSDLLNDTGLSYSNVSAGDRVTAGVFHYDVAASGASDEHVTTAGGVKLYVLVDDNGAVNVEAFGAVGDSNGTTGNGTNDTAAFRAALKFVTDARGGEVIVPSKGASYYRLTGKILFDSNSLGEGDNITFRGTGPAGTRIYCDHSGRGFQFGENRFVSFLDFRNFEIKNNSDSSNILRFDAGAVYCNFDHLLLKHQNTSQIPVYGLMDGTSTDGTGKQVIECTFQRSFYDVTASHATYMFFMQSTTGSRFNSNVLHRLRIHGRDSGSVNYAIALLADGPTGFQSNEITDIVGEQNAGGLILLRGAKNAVVDSVSVHDTTGAIHNDMIALADGSGGAVCENVSIRNYMRTSGTLDASTYDIVLAGSPVGTTLMNIDTMTGAEALEINLGSNPATLINVTGNVSNGSAASNLDGNSLTMGTDDSAPAQNDVTDGAALNPGRFESSRDGGPTGLFNRKGTNGTLLSMRKGGTEVGNISVTGAATAYNTSSDERLKQNFRDFDAGPIIDAISVYRFDWKNSEGSAYGPKAQELYNVAPEAVTPGSVDDMPGDPSFEAWGYDASKLVSILVREIQALRQRVADLETNS